MEADGEPAVKKEEVEDAAWDLPNSPIPTVMQILTE